ncbi:MAG TPA: 5-oxoprolinase subunit PxpB [Marinagarivorans sp.]
MSLSPLNKLRLSWHNENTFTVTFEAAPCVQLTHIIAACLCAIRQCWGDDILDGIPAYDSLMIVIDPWHETPDELAQQAMQLCEREFLSGAVSQQRPSEQTCLTLSIPVLYHQSVAPDLRRVADFCGLTCGEVVELHARKTYTVCALGFAPGFPYLGFVDERIATPRLATPRKSVPEGAVGIAETQTGIYPRQSPGGWNIIGRTPVRCFDVARPIAQASLFTVGQRVRFYAISQAQYDNWPADDPANSWGGKSPGAWAELVNQGRR